MSGVVSFTEIYGQHVELLPSRTMLQTNTPGADGAEYICGSTIDDDTVDIPGCSSTIDNGGYRGGDGVLWYL